MPIVSKAQNRYMRAHQDDPGRLGEVAREFVRETHGKSLKRLPERKRKRRSAPEPERVFGTMSP